MDPITNPNYDHRVSDKASELKDAAVHGSKLPRDSGYDDFGSGARNLASRDGGRPASSGFAAGVTGAHPQGAADHSGHRQAGNLTGTAAHLGSTDITDSTNNPARSGYAGTTETERSARDRGHHNISGSEPIKEQPEEPSGLKKIINKLNPLHKSRSPSPSADRHHGAGTAATAAAVPASVAAATGVGAASARHGHHDDKDLDSSRQHDQSTRKLQKDGPGSLSHKDREAYERGVSSGHQQSGYAGEIAQQETSRGHWGSSDRDSGDYKQQQQQSHHKGTAAAGAGLGAVGATGAAVAAAHKAHGSDHHQHRDGGTAPAGYERFRDQDPDQLRHAHREIPVVGGGTGRDAYPPGTEGFDSSAYHQSAQAVPAGEYRRQQHGDSYASPTAASGPHQTQPHGHTTLGTGVISDSSRHPPALPPRQGGSGSGYASHGVVDTASSTGIRSGIPGNTTTHAGQHRVDDIEHSLRQTHIDEGRQHQGLSGGVVPSHASDNTHHQYGKPALVGVAGGTAAAAAATTAGLRGQHGDKHHYGEGDYRESAGQEKPSMTTRIKDAVTGGSSHDSQKYDSSRDYSGHGTTSGTAAAPGQYSNYSSHEPARSTADHGTSAREKIATGVAAAGAPGIARKVAPEGSTVPGSQYDDRHRHQQQYQQHQQHGVNQDYANRTTTSDYPHGYSQGVTSHDQTTGTYGRTDPRSEHHQSQHHDASGREKVATGLAAAGAPRLAQKVAPSDSTATGYDSQKHGASKNYPERGVVPGEYPPEYSSRRAADSAAGHGDYSRFDNRSADQHSSSSASTTAREKVASGLAAVGAPGLARKVAPAPGHVGQGFDSDHNNNNDNTRYTTAAGAAGSSDNEYHDARAPPQVQDSDNFKPGYTYPPDERRESGQMGQDYRADPAGLPKPPGGGAGQEFQRSTGLYADGGDFDAALPGAGLEGSRLRDGGLR